MIKNFLNLIILLFCKKSLSISFISNVHYKSSKNYWSNFEFYAKKIEVSVHLIHHSDKIFKIFNKKLLQTDIYQRNSYFANISDMTKKQVSYIIANIVKYIVKINL